ncbi:MAG: ribosome recycling factor [Fusobacteriota bacterium]
MSNKILKQVEKDMDEAIEQTKEKLSAVRAGNANISMLDGIMVNSYGVATPLNQVANLSTPDAKTLAISPWDKSMIKEIEKGIEKSNLDLSPSNDGNIIRLTIPDLTADRRKEYLKIAKKETENGKIKIRNIRKEGNNLYRELEKEGEITEDDLKLYEEDIQELTDKYTKKIEELYKIKEKDIKTI